MNKEEMQTMAKEILDTLIKESGLDEVIKKIPLGGGKELDPSKMGKEEKTLRFFKAMFVNDLATAKALTGVESGNALLPTEFLADIIDNVTRQTMSLRGQCTVIPVTYRSGEVPVSTNGLTGVWGNSDSAIGNEQTPTFSDLAYNLKKLNIYTQISNDLLEDTTNASSLYNYLVSLFADAFVTSENKAIVGGSGVGQPEGIRANEDVPTVAVKDAGKFTADDLINLHYTIPAYFRSNCAFIVGTKVVRAMRQFKDLQGRYLWNDLGTGGLPTFNGCPVYELPELIPENLGAGTNETEVICGNFKSYMIFEKKQMEVQLNTTGDSAFLGDKTLMKAVAREDGKVANPKAFARLTGVIV